MYEKVWKRVLDILLSLVALTILSPVLLLLTVMGAIVMRGNPFFLQMRPGKRGKDGKEKLFYLIKFRSMSNRRDAEGNLLPDEVRLGRYGKLLRSTSMDELPELVNILLGHLSVVGPRPQLVRDMVFMTPEQRRRHDVRQGLTGWAQINGRNNITWEQKFTYDLQYIDAGVSFTGDLKIVFATFGKVFSRSDVAREGTVSDVDFGDWLLSEGRITKAEYDEKQKEARRLMGLEEPEKETVTR